MLNDFSICISTCFVFGHDAETRVGERLEADGIKKVLLCRSSDSFLFETGLLDRVKKSMTERGIEVNYLGTDKNESVDYPDKAVECAKEYLKGGYDFSIVLCGTGIGISIAANKIKGIRCALVMDSYSAEMSKRHNNANMLSFGGRVEYKEDPVKILDAYIDATFEGGRHQKRIDKITALENNQ